MAEPTSYRMCSMILRPSFGSSGRLSRDLSRSILLLVYALQVLTSTSLAALPKRLILALDGISYRDMQALQEGVTYQNLKGKQFHRQAFHQGYFPVSRNVSTFPSTSDVAWTDIFGNRPLPGYQRTYFSTAANSQISLNGVTTTLEHEKQMDWQVESGFIRSMGYIYSAHVFEYEMRKLVKNFWNTRSTNADYYAYLRTSDDAQHLDRDIFSLLCLLDKQ